LTGELIERYLDELQVRLSGSPRQIRRMLREVEEHLHDAMEAGLARGLDAGEAEQQAVAAFGPAAGVARACNVSTWQLLRSLAAQALALVGVALVAVGLSGAVIAVMVAAGGSGLRVRRSGRYALPCGRLCALAGPASGSKLVRAGRARRSRV
jgi:HAAS domain-containing protein